MRSQIRQILVFAFILFFFNQKEANKSSQIIISVEGLNKAQKCWVGEKYRIKIRSFSLNIKEKIYLNITNNDIIELNKGYLLMKSRGRECLIAYTKDNNSSICFDIYNTPELKFNETNPLRIEINHDKQLNLKLSDYPNSNIKYKSSHPEIIKVDKKGKITALRPGNAIITAEGLDSKRTSVKVLAISNKGLINNKTMDRYDANQYNNLMIVSHPDDETLWGGANLFREKYFVICLTNGYNIKRANDFKELLKFTNNSGIIMN